MLAFVSFRLYLCRLLHMRDSRTSYEKQQCVLNNMHAGQQKQPFQIMM